MYLIASTILIVHLFTFCSAESSDQRCSIVCKPADAECAFDIRKQEYKLFSSKCAMAAYAKCNGIDFVQTPLKYCMKSLRRYGDSCPVFCPNYYSPVCGALKFRSYNYRTFTNGCYLDLINCRGDEDVSTYIEVPLHFCQNHAMKNIFKEQVVVSNIHDYEDYGQF